MIDRKKTTGIYLLVMIVYCRRCLGTLRLNQNPNHKTSNKRGDDVLTDEGLKFRELFLKRVVVNLIVIRPYHIIVRLEQIHNGVRT